MEDYYKILAKRTEFCNQMGHKTNAELDAIFPLPPVPPNHGHQDDSFNDRFHNSDGNNDDGGNGKNKNNSSNVGRNSKSSPQNQNKNLTSSLRIQRLEKLRDKTIENRKRAFLAQYPDSDISSTGSLKWGRDAIYGECAKDIANAAVPDSEIELVLDYFSFLSRYHCSGSLLHHACAAGRLAIVEYFLQQNVGCNITDSNGYIPIHLAVKSGHSKIVDILLKHGNSLEARDKQGRTALLIAAFFGQYEMVRNLLNIGANPAAKDNHGQNAEALAKIGGYKNVVDAIKSHAKRLSHDTMLKDAASRFVADDKLRKLLWDVFIGGIQQRITFNDVATNDLESVNIERIRTDR